MAESLIEKKKEIEACAIERKERKKKRRRKNNNNNNNNKLVSDGVGGTARGDKPELTRQTRTITKNARGYINHNGFQQPDPTTTTATASTATTEPPLPYPPPSSLSPLL